MNEIEGRIVSSFETLQLVTHNGFTHSVDCFCFSYYESLYKERGKRKERQVFYILVANQITETRVLNQK